MRVTKAEILSAGRKEIREEAWYAGEDSASYACVFNGDIVSVQFYWIGDRYPTKGFFIPHAEGEAESMQLLTVPQIRGKGLARALFHFSTYDMMVNRGFSRLYGRIWFSNYPSIRVVESCGWEHISTVVIMQPRIWRKELRWTLPVRKRRVCGA
jgi:GNAT superfamily N-acetyltransferase